MANFGIVPEQKASLCKTSPDYDAMKPYWVQVDDFAAGVERLRQVGKRQTYLPRFPSETDDNYNYRNDNSVLTDVFGDVVGSLAAKPFTKEAGLYDDDPPANMQALVEDVDRSGDHLHVFAQAVFHDGIAYGLDWIMVDHTSLAEGATLADERAAGARPYLVRIAAEDMLFIKSAMTAQGEQYIFVKINESYLDDDGNPVEKVRLLIRDELSQGVYDTPRFEVWEQRKGLGAVLTQEGPISLSVIPLVPFYTGRRIPGTHRFTLPMKRIISLQVEHYQAQTNLKLAKEQACFPMLVGRGINPPKGDDKLPVGASTVLYAPMSADGKFGDWRIIEPSTESLQFLSSECSKIESAMRELGRMPLTANSAGITAIAAQMGSERANSAVQSWVYQLKNVLEKALGWCAEWMGSDYKPEVRIDTDFAVELTDATEPALLKGLAMPDSGQPPLMSMETFYNEYKRRGITAPEVNAVEERKRLESEAQFRQELADKYPAAQPATAKTTAADRRIGEPETTPDTGTGDQT